ncbi:MAG: sulfate ABC transporter ATP-binding protein [Helicobacteraceae bacterium]|jgi:sulfate transport system ATP-binding protein|nr:sulfate ABC transporter ATP-binding protein [Helicobacteraceae bacterium]
MSIEIDNVTKRFGSFTALENVSITIKEGELTGLLGPSGSGKTTLLRIIAGLENADSGAVRFFGEEAGHKSIRDRNVGFVFQHYALFKHMSVFENVSFGLKARPRATRPNKNEIKDRVFKLLKMVQLESMANRLPNELSGGQKQRVALARALAVEPKILLLDEPFGALDAKVRQELRRWLRFLHDEIRVTSVFVTHDQEEALEVSDSIVIFNKGRVEQIGAPEEVYDNPRTPFVYSFLGNVNLFRARIEQGTLKLDGGAGESDLKFFIRPHNIDISPIKEHEKAIESRIVAHRFLGGRVRVELVTLEGAKPIEADIDKARWNYVRNAKPDTVFISFKEAKIYSQNNEWNDYVI